MRQSTLKKYIGILTDIKISGLSIKAYCDGKDICPQNIYNTISKLKQQNEEESGMVSELLSLYNEVSGRRNKQLITDDLEEPSPELPKYLESTTDTEDGVETDDAAETSYIRDDDGKIKFYKYQIFRRNKAPLCGKLTREEMSTIHRLYSYYGDALTQRVISRHFVDLSLIDFKRILRAFNITKASAPFAPHMIEECTENELRDIQLREKENSFLRKAEEDQIKNNEKLLKKYAQENIELNKLLSNRRDAIKLLSDLDIAVDKPIKIKPNSTCSDLVIFLSDLHIGAFNERQGYISLPGYDEEEITRRLSKIIDAINRRTYNSITVCNLGDSVDSYNKQTTRGGHELPTVISNKEQSILYQKIMLGFFNNLIGISPKISYICVGESNHDGDWGWINNVVLAGKLKEKFNIDSYISNNPIDKFDINDVSIVYLHGKDNKNQYKGFPLTLDPKTESWFNAYFIDSGESFKKRKCVVKGDLHQYAYTCAKHFDYISSPSLYGSSNWIAANFGKTPWGVLIMEIDSLNNIKTSVIGD